MLRKVVAIWVSLAMVFGFIMIVDTTMDIIPTVKGTTYYVNETGSGGAFTSIQSAIDAANPGDTVFVYSGTYSENVNVNKMINLIGEDKDLTVVDGGGTGDVVHVTSNWVNVTGFTFTNGGSGAGEVGIELDNVNNCSVIFNNCTDSYYGIYLYRSDDNDIQNNTVVYNRYGISIHQSQDNYVFNNTAHDNILDGITMPSSYYNTIDENTVYYNGQQGISATGDYNTIKNNLIYGTHYHGVALYPGCDYNKVEFNTIYGAMSSGIRVDGSDYNSIENNVAYNNLYGSWARRNSNHNIYKDNKFYNNIDYGIYLHSAKDNIIHNNIIYGHLLDGIRVAKASGYWDPVNNTITNNTIFNNGRRGISLEYSDHTVKNNTVYGSTGLSSSGIYGNTVTNTKIEDNIVHDNRVGIRLFACNTNSIRINTVYNNIWDGVNIGGSYNTVTENTIYNNNLNGIIFAGIYNTVIDNIVYNNSQAGMASYSGDSVINDNNIYGTHTHGIYFYLGSYNNTLKNNTVSDAILSGIYMEGSYNSTIENNMAFNNTYGIWSRRNSHNNNYLNNTLHNNNDIGMLINSSRDEMIHNNTIYNNTNDGIRVLKESGYQDPEYNIFSNNSILNNSRHGFYFSNADNNIMFNNTIFNSLSDGIRLESSFNNKIYHNSIISNTVQATDDSNNGNQWDNGYPSGGNYWSDYGGIDSFKGPFQDIPGSDSIGDTPYVIDADSLDNYPLMAPFIQHENYTILKQGWNLISIPFIQVDQSIPKVLEMIEGYYDAVQWYNPNDLLDLWKDNKISKSFGNDLFKLNETISFWIHITRPGDTIFIYNGTQPIVSQIIKLYNGWNMVGYPSLSNHTRTVGLNNLVFDIDVDAIQWYNAAAKSWHFMGPSDPFVPGRGYWMHSKVETSWIVPL
jgi:parallel beta-helix repeat protein